LVSANVAKRERQQLQESTQHTSARPRSYHEPKTWSIYQTHPHYHDA
ncbi:10822_t:CDS:1, partial [Rhizophagus irregularis]